MTRTYPRAFAVLLLPLIATACGQPHPASSAAATPTSPPPPLATKPSVGQEVGAVAANKVEIDFPFGGATLTPDANAKLDLATRLFRDVNPVAMFSIGHADGVGSEYSNVVLSAQRALAVKRALVERGIPADRILVQALGESEPANSSDPTAAENRRVVVQWRIL